MDCAGTCGGTQQLDCANQCGGTFAEDCNDDCGGSAVDDCNVDCGGPATTDSCGTCDADPLNDCGKNVLMFFCLCEDIIFPSYSCFFLSESCVCVCVCRDKLFLGAACSSIFSGTFDTNTQFLISFLPLALIKVVQHLKLYKIVFLLCNYHSYPDPVHNIPGYDKL